MSFICRTVEILSRLLARSKTFSLLALPNSHIHSNVHPWFNTSIAAPFRFIATNSTVKVSAIDYRGRCNDEGSISLLIARQRLPFYTILQIKVGNKRRSGPFIHHWPRRFEAAALSRGDFSDLYSFPLSRRLRTIGSLTGIGLVKYHFNAD